MIHPILIYMSAIGMTTIGRGKCYTWHCDFEGPFGIYFPELNDYAYYSSVNFGSLDLFPI